MTTNNFSQDKNMSKTFVSRSSQTINSDFINEIKAAISDENNKIRLGRLVLVRGISDGICIHSELCVGGDYGYECSTSEATEHNVSCIMERINLNIEQTEAHFSNKTSDANENIKAIISSLLSKFYDGASSYKFKPLTSQAAVDTLIESILAKNEELGCNLKTKSGRVKFLKKALDKKYWLAELEAGVDHLYKSLDDAALVIADKFDLEQLCIERKMAS